MFYYLFTSAEMASVNGKMMAADLFDEAIQEAYNAYRQWEAYAKVRQLETEYSTLMHPPEKGSAALNLDDSVKAVRYQKTSQIQLKGPKKQPY